MCQSFIVAPSKRNYWKFYTLHITLIGIGMDFFKRHKNKFLTFGVVSAIGGVGLYVFDKYVESRVAEQREIETQKQLKFVSFTVSHLNLASFKVAWIWLKSLQTNFLYRFYLNCQKTNRNQFSFLLGNFHDIKAKKMFKFKRRNHKCYKLFKGNYNDKSNLTAPTTLLKKL